MCVIIRHCTSVYVYVTCGGGDDDGGGLHNNNIIIIIRQLLTSPQIF